jgi:hypothetical protein
MATQAGQYNHAFNWMPRVLTLDTATGQQVQSWPTSSGTLWGSLDEQTAALDSTAGALQGSARVIITLRNFVSVKTNDQLIEQTFGDVFIVDSARRDFAQNVTILDAHRYETLTYADQP